MLCHVVLWHDIALCLLYHSMSCYILLYFYVFSFTILVYCCILKRSILYHSRSTSQNKPNTSARLIEDYAVGVDTPTKERVSGHFWCHRHTVPGSRNESPSGSVTMGDACRMPLAASMTSSLFLATLHQQHKKPETTALASCLPGLQSRARSRLWFGRLFFIHLIRLPSHNP